MSSRFTDISGQIEYTDSYGDKFHINNYELASTPVDEEKAKVLLSIFGLIVSILGIREGFKKSSTRFYHSATEKNLSMLYGQGLSVLAKECFNNIVNYIRTSIYNRKHKDELNYNEVNNMEGRKL